MARYVLPPSTTTLVSISDNDTFTADLPQQMPLPAIPLQGVNSDRRALVAAGPAVTVYNEDWLVTREAPHIMRKWNNPWCILGSSNLNAFRATLRRGETLEGAIVNNAQRYDNLVAAIYNALGDKVDEIKAAGANGMWLFVWKDRDVGPVIVMASIAGLAKTEMTDAEGRTGTYRASIVILSTRHAPAAGFERSVPGIVNMVSKLLYVMNILQGGGLAATEGIYATQRIPVPENSDTAQWLALAVLLRRTVEVISTSGHTILKSAALIAATHDVLAYWHQPLTHDRLISMLDM